MFKQAIPLERFCLIYHIIKEGQIYTQGFRQIHLHNHLPSRREHLEPHKPGDRGKIWRTGTYILKARIAGFIIPQKKLNFPQISSKMPQNGPKIAKNDPKWPKYDPKWP